MAMRKQAPHNKIDVNINDIKNMYVDKGMTAKQISESIGVSTSIIYNRLRVLGVVRKNGTWQKGKRPANYKGRYMEKRTGYVLVNLPKGHPYYDMAPKNKNPASRSIREHRLVMAQYLGRLLKRHEIVHHINGNKRDNRIENLELIQGQAHHNGHTITQREFDRIYKIISSCDICKAALEAVNHISELSV